MYKSRSDKTPAEATNIQTGGHSRAISQHYELLQFIEQYYSEGRYAIVLKKY